MNRPFSQIEVDQIGEVYCVHLRNPRLDEIGLEELGAEMARLVDEMGCVKMILVLGPEEPLCLYSVFLAKLVNLQRRLNLMGGALGLAQVSLETMKIFQATGLDKYFSFYPDRESAMAALAA